MLPCIGIPELINVFAFDASNGARMLNGSLLHAPSEFKGGGRHEYTAKAFNIPYTGL